MTESVKKLNFLSISIITIITLILWRIVSIILIHHVGAQNARPQRDAEDQMGMMKKSVHIDVDGNKSIVGLQTIKSLSAYGEHILLLYGDSKDTESLQYIRYRPYGGLPRDQPLFAIDPDSAEVFEFGQFYKIFAQLKSFLLANELVSLLQWNEKIMLAFFRSLNDYTISYAIVNAQTKQLYHNQLMPMPANANGTIMVHHYVENSNTTMSSNASTFANNVTNETSSIINSSIKNTAFEENDTSVNRVHFIALHDPAYQDGLAIVNHIHSSSTIEIIFQPNRTMLFGAVIAHHRRQIYLLEDRLQSLKYTDFVPLSDLLSLSQWRPILFYNHLYLWTGNGSVYYFQLISDLSLFAPNATIALFMGEMSGQQFFATRNQTGHVIWNDFTNHTIWENPTFPPPTGIVYSTSFWRSTLFYTFIVLLLLILLLVMLDCCGYPIQQTKQNEHKRCINMNPFAQCCGKVRRTQVVKNSFQSSESDSTRSSTSAFRSTIITNININTNNQSNSTNQKKY